MTLQKLLERFLGTCVRLSFEREQPFVICVAGSVGKTSTKTAIGVALGADEPGSRVVTSQKNYNNEIGVPLTVFGCDAPGRSLIAWSILLGKALLTRWGVLPLRAKIFVLEMGVDRPGDLAYLTSIAQPNVGVLTAIGPEHTEFFGSIENVAGEEITILRALKPDGVAVLNGDDEMIRTISQGLRTNVFSFGTAEDATARIVEHHLVIDEQSPEASGIETRLSMMGTSWTIRLTGTVGRPQAYAVAAALAVVSAIDGEEAQALDRIQKRFHGMPGRMRLVEGIKRTWLIDDSYNSSPLAALSALRDLAAFPIREGAQRIAALGDMLELGNLAEPSHEEIGRAVAESNIDVLVACGALAHIVVNAAIAARMPRDNIFTFADSREAGLFIQARLREGDVVLVKGSQGGRMERVTKELMAHPERAGELLVRQAKEWLEKE